MPKPCDETCCALCAVIGRPRTRVGTGPPPPGCLGQNRRPCARVARRSDAIKLAVLPLPDPPETGRHVVLHLDLADHGIEGCGLQILDDGFAIDLADAFDGL